LAHKDPLGNLAYKDRKVILVRRVPQARKDRSVQRVLLEAKGLLVIMARKVFPAMLDLVVPLAMLVLKVIKDQAVQKDLVALQANPDPLVLLVKMVLQGKMAFQVLKVLPVIQVLAVLQDPPEVRVLKV